MPDATVWLGEKVGRRATRVRPQRAWMRFIVPLVLLHRRELVATMLVARRKAVRHWKARQAAHSMVMAPYELIKVQSSTVASMILFKVLVRLAEWTEEWPRWFLPMESTRIDFVRITFRHELVFRSNKVLLDRHYTISRKEHPRCDMVMVQRRAGPAFGDPAVCLSQRVLRYLRRRWGVGSHPSWIATRSVGIKGRSGGAATRFGRGVVDMHTTRRMRLI